MATKVEERTSHIALLSLFQTLGFIVGPGLQVINDYLLLGVKLMLIYEMFQKLFRSKIDLFGKIKSLEQSKLFRCIFLLQLFLNIFSLTVIVVKQMFLELQNTTF